MNNVHDVIPMTFKSSVNGKLTEKQKQMKNTIAKICFSFYDQSKKTHVSRTWSEIKSITGLSKGALSKHLRELISQGVVKVEGRLDEEGHLKKFYTYTREPFKIKGKAKEPAVMDMARIFHDKGKIEGVIWGYSKRGKYGKRYVVDRQGKKMPESI